MAIKHTCKYCKKRSEEAQKFGISYFCDIKCAALYGQKKAQEKREKEHKAKQVKFKEKVQGSDLKTRKRAAKDACHAYIRERDKNETCICCDKELGSEYHAGHYLPSGQNSILRYHEDNIHGQRIDCNYYKGGDSGNYKENLIAKIGQERYDYLMNNKGGSIKRTAEDYKKIEDYYKQKLKELSE